MGSPTPPIRLAPLAADVARLGSVSVDATRLLLALRATGAAVSTATDERAEAGRDWWPLAMAWALQGQVAAVATAVVAPSTTEQVAAIARLCNDARIPLTAAGGRSGVCGASVPVHGGVALSLTGLQGIVAIDETSLVVEVLSGTFGDEFEAELRERGFTAGHWPQSIALSTVGGWAACRGAGQYSTRYGKIEDIVLGLEVVLADGRVVRTGGAAHAAVGPDLTQVFLGSEGTLGIITRVWLKLHRLAPAERRGAWSFPSFEAGAVACRRILQRGATPAVLRLYDPVESQRSHGTSSTANLLVLDEGEPALIDAVMSIVAEECAEAAVADVDLVERWLHHRNDVSALEALTHKGFVVDTMEVTTSWTNLDRVFHDVRSAMLAVPHARAATCHLSHSYADGACLYFSFAATPPSDEHEATYIALWNAGQNAALNAGARLSHHHGVGLNRHRFVRQALGTGLDVVESIKSALDPTGILNPGKLGLTSAFGPAAWPVPSS